MGRKADVALGQPGQKLRWVATRKFDNLIQKGSALYQADRLSMNNALKASLSQGLAPIYDSGGKKLVEQTIQKIKKMDEFATKYKMEDKKFLNKWRAKTYLRDYAVDNGEDANKLINEYMTHFRTYKTELEPIMSKSRAALAAFYVTDNMREFGSVRMIDKGNNRMFFALKKWAIGKAGEYAYRIHNEIWADNVSDIIRNLGKSKSLQQMGIEVAQFMRMWWLIEKSTGGEYEAEDFMYQMAVPMVVLAMTILDPIYQWRNRFNDYRQAEEDIFTAVVAWALETINEMSATAFLYQSWALSRLEQSMDTAAAYEDNMGYLGKMITTFWHSLMWRALGRMYPKYRGMNLNTLYDGSATTDMVEWLTNTDSTLQMSVREKADTAFAARRIANGWGVQQVVGMAITDYPLVKLASNLIGAVDSSKSYGNNYNVEVLANSINEYIEDNNLYLFNKQYIKTAEEKEQLFELIDNFENQRLFDAIKRDKDLEWEKFLEKIKNGTASREEVDQMFKEVGTPHNLAMWNDIKNALKFNSGFAKELGEIYGDSKWWLYKSDISTEELNGLSEEFLSFVRNNDIKVSNDQNALIDFINARWELWSNYVLSDYMSAYESGMWKLMREKYDLDDRYDMFEQGTDKVSDFLPEASTNPAYLAAVKEQRDILKWQIFDMRDIVMWENPYIGMQLKEKYLSNAIDAPVKVSGVLSDYVLVNDIQKELRENGYMTDDFMGYMNFINWSISKNMDYAQWKPEDKERGVNLLLKNANAILETVEDTSMSSVEEASMKAGLAYGMQWITDMITDISKAEYEKFSESTKNAIKWFITSLTGSSPTSVKTALEYSTDKNLSGWDWGDGKKVKQSKGNWGKQYDKIELALNKARAAGLSIPGYKTQLSKTAIPKMSRTHRNIRISLPKFDIDDIVIEKWMVSRSQPIKVEKPSDTTEKLKIKRKSVSSRKSTKRSPKKIKSFSI